MIKPIWQVLRMTIIVMVFAVVAIGLRSASVNAQGVNQFPSIENSTEWNASSRSPDARLTWLFNGDSNHPNGGIITGKTTHILRNRTIGRNEGTRLRLYYKTQPTTVSVTINVVECELKAGIDFDGKVQVDLGGRNVYNQPTRGKKIDSAQNRYGWELSNRTTGRRYDLKNQPDVVTNSSLRSVNDSPVCKNLPDYSYEFDRYNETCADPNNAGTRCADDGTEAYVFKNNNTKTFTSSDGSPYGEAYALGNKLDGRTFTKNWGDLIPSRKGLDAKTELYYADLDIDLTGQDASANGSGASTDMMQRITFTVTANNSVNANGNTVIPKMGYRTPDNLRTDEDAARFFGLQGNGGRNDDFPGYGQKYAIPFGPDCGSGSANGRVVLYDPDIGGYGDVYAAVFRRNPERNNDGSYTVQQLGTGNFNDRFNFVEGGNNRLQSNAGGSGSKSAFTLTMQEGWQYMLVVMNPNTGPMNPSSNVFSVRLPTDSIAGLVNCRYNLDPNLTNVPGVYSAYGDTITGTATVKNTNEDSVAGEHDWRIVKARFSSRPADFANRTSDTISPLNPCVFIAGLNSNRIDCDASFHTGTYVGDQSYDFSDTVGEQPIGTYICYMTAVKNPTWRNDDDSSWRYSPMQCSVAGVKPKLQVWGGDVKAGGAGVSGIHIDTSTSQLQSNNRTYGSWGEYGVFSNGGNIGMASGRGLSGGNLSASQGSWSALTFANSLFFGYYGGVQPLAYNPGEVTQNLPNIGGVCSLTARDYPVGAKEVIYCDGTLTVEGNQSYAPGVTSISQIQNVKIVARNIRVATDVTKIDPWVVARQSNGTYGSIHTCNNVTGNATSATCPEQIKFNGPVLANSLYAFRTHDSATGDPAEIFNLRANNILSAYAGRGTNQPVARTELVTELPPRF